MSRNGRAPHNSGAHDDLTRRLRIGTMLILACACACVLAPPAQSRPLNLDPLDFSNFIAKEMRQSLPRATIQVVGPLHLQVTLAPNDVHDVSLDTIFSACSRTQVAEICAADMQTFVEQATVFDTAPSPALDRKSLRIAVRGSDLIRALRQQMAGKGGPVATPIAGDYSALVVSDLPTVIRMVSIQELAAIGLTPDQAMAAARRNMTLGLRNRLKKAAKSDGSAVVLLSGSPYASSLFAFPDLWAPVAAAFGGKLLVALPAEDVVLCGNGAAPGMAGRLADSARTVMTDDEHPLSAAVFQWTPEGWTPAR